MKRFKSVLLSLALVVAFLGASLGQNVQLAFAAPTQTVTISAAASLKESLTEIQKKFQAQNKNIKLQINYGASGTLQKQIENGAPVDLFLSADKKNVDELSAKSQVEKKSIKNILSNTVVLLVNKSHSNTIKSVNDLTKSSVKRISVGSPEFVPVGIYTKQSLQYLKVWDKVKGKIVYGKDVKQVLTYIESGNVAAGFVYGSDAKTAKKSVVKQVLSSKSHKPIIYTGAVISSSKQKAAAQKFLTYLSTKENQSIFKKYGFASVK